MARWKNAPQKREQEAVLTRDLISMDISKMSELEFRITIIKMQVELGEEKHIEDTRKSVSGEIKELKSNEVEIKKAINEMQ